MQRCVHNVYNCFNDGFARQKLSDFDKIGFPSGEDRQTNYAPIDFIRGFVSWKRHRSLEPFRFHYNICLKRRSFQLFVVKLFVIWNSSGCLAETIYLRNRFDFSVYLRPLRLQLRRQVFVLSRCDNLILTCIYFGFILNVYSLFGNYSFPYCKSLYFMV